MNAKEFSRALLSALKDDDVNHALHRHSTDSMKSEILPIMDAIANLRKEIKADFGEQMNNLRQTVASLKDIITKKDETIASLEKRVEALEQSQDDLEQYSRRNSVRLSGLVENKKEDTAALAIDVLNDRMKLTPPLTINELDRVHRVGKPSAETEAKPRAILMKFSTYRSKQRVHSAKRHLYTEDDDLPKLFLNEDLTRRRSELLWEARKLKKDGRIQDAWSANGTLLLKDNRNAVVTFKSLKELNSKI